LDQAVSEALMFSPKPARFKRVKSVNAAWFPIAIELDMFDSLSIHCAGHPLALVLSVFS
jgi:hypothetical protein